MEKTYKPRFFDFEVYPNWWCVVLGDYPEDDTDVPESIKDNFYVISSDTPDGVRKLFALINDNNYVHMGYNIKKYDNIILNAIHNGLSPQQVKIINDLIVGRESDDSAEASLLMGMSRQRYRSFVYQDLMDDNTGSLKEKEACMKIDIRETTVPFDKEDLTEEDKENIIFYCKHDVWSTMKFYQVILKPFVETKLLVGRVFGIPAVTCYRSTNAILSGIVLGAEHKHFDDAEKITMKIPQGLEQYIRYSLPNDLVDKICNSTDKFDYKMYGDMVSFGNGGVHSVPLTPDGKKACENVIIDSNDEWALINADAASFYPATMIAWHTLTRAVKNPEKFADMYHARLNFKKVIEPFEEKWGKNTKDAPADEYEHYRYCKETSQAYKLILNTTYGASGNKWLPLYDPYMTTVTCRLGQLLLASLANNIYNQVGKSNVMIVQNNTDGILMRIRRSHLEQLQSICDAFTDVTHIMIELEEEQKIWQCDVNNYLMIKHSGREKTKGGFFVIDMQQPGYNRVRPLNTYVCRKAIMEYLHYGKSIVKTIVECRDLSKFVITANKGVFSGMIRKFNDGTPDERLDRCNRMYASKNKRLGEVKKLKKYRGELREYKAPGCPPHCELINASLDSYNFDIIKNDIDYMWYVEETIRLMSGTWYNCVDTKLIPFEINEESLIN